MNRTKPKDYVLPPMVHNSSGVELAEAERLPVIAMVNNKWRQRHVTVHALPDSEVAVISIGRRYDGSEIIVCREQRADYSLAISMFPQTQVYA
jgi:hypothetical protein